MEKCVLLKYEPPVLTAVILRDIDHHSAAYIRGEIDPVIRRKRPKQLVLDFQPVEFMDSSGVGLVMGRLKQMQSVGGTLKIQNLNRRCRRLLEMSGITRIVSI